MDDASVDVRVEEIEKRRAEAPVRYEDDLHAWAMEQAEHLKAGRFDALDLINLADEVADVGHSQYDKLVSDLARVIQHLLKWDYQAERRSRSWASSVREHRKRVVRQLEKTPSLKGRSQEIIADAYERGRGDALIETGLSEAAIPDNCFLSWDEVMTRPVVWPEP